MENKILAGYLDGTILSASASPDDINRLCIDAVNYSFASVCVNAVNIPLINKLLSGSDVKTCTVIGFPLGETTTAEKVWAAKEAASLSTAEIDMVASVSRLKSGDYNYYLTEIEAVKSAIGDRCLKVIIETCYLDENEIRRAVELCVKGGADYIKTSTGFGTRGASLADIEIISGVLNNLKQNTGICRNIGIKASGGINNKEFAEELIKRGATRLGVSKYAAILK